MSKLYNVTGRCCPSKDGATAYLYSIVPTSQNGVAAITSAGELLVVDGQSLSTSPILRLQDVPLGVSCLILSDEAGTTTACCGADGTVAIHDLRSQVRASYFKLDKALTALSRKGHAFAVGSELSDHQSIVSVWDQRQNKQIWQNAENNDDITAVDFHPTNGNMLLAGGDDGQVSIFDISIPEEDDSLIQGVNHGPIHKAGFLGSDRFFALSSDQNMSIHSISTPGDEADPNPTLLGDLRPTIPCEYAIDVFRTGNGFAVAAGSNIGSQKVKIVEIEHAADPGKSPRLQLESGYILEGAHGEEVVRSLFVDDAKGTIFTAGEDGAIQAFQSSGMKPIAPKQSKSGQVRKNIDGRYKPY